ncbi:MAG: DUF1284 domain-containing protein [Proteobacteria bacterium]|nr:DUF1284 domain-containing protein [Pseudomonadota bacterium]
MLKFRPHHFMCTLGFRGVGYSKDFVRNYKEIVQTLKDAPNTPIAVVFGGDAICAPCPNLKLNGLCITQEKIDTLDKAHIKALGLQDGQTITWQQAKSLIRDKMSLEQFHQACAPCRWKELGICEQALKDLLTS